MKLLIYEFFTGGLADAGFGARLPGLATVAAPEGAAMLRSAMEDFSRIGSVQPFSIANHEYVDRLGDIGGVRFCDSGGAALAALDRAMDESDAVLAIAPEMGGALHAILRLVEQKGKISLGCAPEAVRIAGDKLIFAEKLETAGVPHPVTVKYSSGKNHFDGAWILKPRDGAGSFMVKKFNGKHGPVFDGPSAPDEFIAQEFAEGEPMSVSVVSAPGEDIILSVNRQKLSPDMEYLGGEILDSPPPDALEQLVKSVRKAVPGLVGCWGADFIQTAAGPVVIEVNPRLTTPYVALSRALDVNPAEAMLSAALGGRLPRIKERRRVTFNTAGEVSTTP